MRQTGYYWVKQEHYGWCLAAYFSDTQTWDLWNAWMSKDYKDEHLAEINEERILNPDEK
jgi:hypothetical protein